VVLFLDAIYLPVRPSGPKEGVICAWGITETGARALVSVRLGMREAKEDWLELGLRPHPLAGSRRHAWSSPTARPD
jgi:transposase-like protein